jgi:hypothetical protein
MVHTPGKLNTLLLNLNTVAYFINKSLSCVSSIQLFFKTHQLFPYFCGHERKADSCARRIEAQLTSFPTQEHADFLPQPSPTLHIVYHPTVSTNRANRPSEAPQHSVALQVPSVDPMTGHQALL